MASPRPKTPKPQYSPHKRTRIALGFEAGLTYKALAAVEGVSPGSIYGIVKRYRVQKSAKSLSRPLRPRSLTDRDIRHMLRFIHQNPFISALELKTACSFTCHPVTITRELRRQGIQHYKALRRPKLSEEHAKKRLAFAKEHINKPLSEWKCWIFSDELIIARGQGERTGWVFCRKVRNYTPLFYLNYSTLTTV